ncbi:uncharacterized protein LOC111700434 [Eurytemora carolleeae]|uniref:uncharacterized protein LOC111700434 n=1 Tax=Eurytemora carolleeae TaxID=1294199 RepID=UPI000C790140|nr:uncharacterized protein LOC111700434 [Eurytemora carolleeae]|eukprot:XP_023327104.1 uncharacterized protein LOC111700434 [Eurytemora affinis]
MSRDTSQLEERVLMILSTPWIIFGSLLSLAVIFAVLVNKKLHKPRHIFQALSLLSSLISVCVGLYGICFGFTSSRIIDFCPRSVFYTMIFNRYLLLLSDILPSLDRFVAIISPLQYHIHATANKARFISFMAIILSLMLATVAFVCGIIPDNLGSHAMDHFYLTSTRQYMYFLTLPFACLLIVCFTTDTIAMLVALSHSRKRAQQSEEIRNSSERRATFASTASMSRSQIEKESTLISQISLDSKDIKGNLEGAVPGKKIDTASISDLKISMKCLALSFWFFISQLCTYTPGILFLGCGDNMNKPKEEIEDENFEASCHGLVGLMPRVIIYLFYQLQFGKVFLFLCLDPELRNNISGYYTRLLHSGQSG